MKCEIFIQENESEKCLQNSSHFCLGLSVLIWKCKECSFDNLMISFKVGDKVSQNHPALTMLIWRWKYSMVPCYSRVCYNHYNAMVSQIPSIAIVYSTAYSKHRSKKTSKLCVTGLCEGNSLVTGELPWQRDSNAGNVYLWWCHHDNGTQL